MTYNGRNSMGWRTRSGLLAAVGAALAVGSLPARAAVGPDLGAARSFAALGGSTLTNTGATTAIVGDVGVSPGSAVVGLTPAQVNGGVYVGGTTKADQAHSDASLAYFFLKGMASDTNLTSTDLGGLTLSPGVYTFNSSAALTGAMFLDAGGDSNAVFVFQVGTSFTSASGSSVTVINGGADYDESKIFWQVGSSATLGTTTAFLGIIVADQAVTLETGATLTGIALAINGATSLDSNAVTSPPVYVAPPVTLPPINLTAVLSGTGTVPAADLSWNDASDNETEFRVFRRDGAGPLWVLLATIPSTDMAGATALLTYNDPVLVADTTYTYRVTAFGAAAGESVPSNEALVDTGVFVPAILAPINLTAVLGGTAGSESGDLSWTDVSDNETGFNVYRRDGAGPDFVQVGTVDTLDTPGIVGTMTFNDPILDPSVVYTYRVTAYNLVDGESLPSNEALLQTSVALPVRWLDLDLGRRRNVIRDRNRAHGDQLSIKGSFSVIDIDTGIPTVIDDMDPRTDGVTVQVKAPGNIVLLTIPANDPNWKASKRGIYRWKTRDGGRAPLTILRIDTRKSEVTLKNRRAEFGSVPVNSITVTMTAQGATGSDTRTWNKPKRLEKGLRALLTLPK